MKKQVILLKPWRTISGKKIFTKILPHKKILKIIVKTNNELQWSKLLSLQHLFEEQWKALTKLPKRMLLLTWDCLLLIRRQYLMLMQLLQETVVSYTRKYINNEFIGVSLLFMTKNKTLIVAYQSLFYTYRLVGYSRLLFIQTIFWTLQIIRLILICFGTQFFTKSITSILSTSVTSTSYSISLYSIFFM